MKIRLTAYVTSGVAIAIIFLFAVWYPVSEQVGTLKTDIASAEGTLIDFNRTMEQLPQFISARGDLEASRHKLQSSLYAKDDILALLGHINHQLDSLGLTVVDISPPVSELLELNHDNYDPTDPNFLNLTYQVTGGFVPFGKFVEILEKDTYFRGVNLCRMNGARDHSTATLFTIGFKALLGQIDEQDSGAES